MKARRWDRKERRRWIREKSRKGMFVIPSLFTVSNIFCGFCSVSASIIANYELAAILIGIAMILDTLDGRMARLTHTSSQFGLQLDSLADVITFGMAPAVLCYQWAFYRFEVQSIDRAGWLGCFLFLICAASRLARFNVQTSGTPDKRYFIGMPTPAAAGFVAATVYCFPDRLHGDGPAIAALFMMLLMGFLMVSQIKYRSFKDFNLKQPRSYRVTVVLALAIVSVALDPHHALIILACIYTISGIIGTFFWRKRKEAEIPHPAAAAPSAQTPSQP